MKTQRRPRNTPTKKALKEKFIDKQIQEEKTIESTQDIKPNFNILPLRPKGNYSDKFSKTRIVSNLYKIDYNTNLTICIYSVKIQPNIKQDSTRKFNSLVNSMRKNLKPHLGTNFVISGRTIYACQPCKNQKEEIIMKTKFENQSYDLIFKYVKKIDFKNVDSEIGKESILPLNFMNNLIKQLFTELNFVEVGKSGKYIDPRTKFNVPQAGIMMFNGYSAAVSMMQGGMYLKVDGLIKIVQEKTGLQFINSIYAQHSHLSKEQKRSIVRDSFIGKSVVANYGNSRHWRVTDVIFDLDFDKDKIAQETNLTYSEYYQVNYGMKIKSKKQPVLKAVINGKRKTQGILIPEFVLISGLPQNFDQRKRRQISQKSIINPDVKLNNIQSLIDSFNTDCQNFSNGAISDNLGIKISKEPEKIDAFSISPPQLRLGGNNSVEQNKATFFNLFNKPLYSTNIALDIMAFIPDDYDFTGVSKLFDSTCRNLSLKHSISTIKIRFQDLKKVTQEIRSYVEDKTEKFKNKNFFWFILPGKMKNLYAPIKKICMSTKDPKLTQVSLTSTLAKKGFASIITKILIQIASKLGNVPWCPRISKSMSRGIMMIGMEIARDTSNKKNMIITYCSTVNDQCNKFHTNYRFQETGIKYNEKMKEIIAQCLAVFGKQNNTFPSQIILMKYGSSDSEKSTLIDKQISQVKSVLNNLKDFTVKLTYASVDLSSSHKFFVDKQKVINPSSGTLINSKVVGNHYDFYMVSQQCNRGTVKPVHYQVLYSDSSIEEGILQEFIYGQCFNYMNWSGPVRVPGVLQYARKLSKLITEHLHEHIPMQKLSKNLFFI